MRYREEQAAPDPDYPYSQGMHSMLTASVALSLVIGAVLLYLGKRGNIMWLSWWSGGLMVCSAIYLAIDALNIL